ncbi:MAG: hypothetical protein IJY22_01950 [Clostridia bacterium]|nr:hypothetical protein [Clostridia bacterium]
MAQIMCEITLDVSVNDSGQVMMAKQGDSKSRLLCVHFTDKRKPMKVESGASVLLNVSAGGEARSFVGYVSDGDAIFVIPAFALAAAGNVSCDVSILGGDGGRLTTAGFEICVAESVCPDGDLGEETADLAAELLAQDTIQTLTPVSDGAAYVIAPTLNRKYALDLSAPAYTASGSWATFRLELPTPLSAEQENWVLIYCHAPVSERAGAIVIDWGDAGERLFADGEIPYVTMGDFDIVCTYSPAAEKWQIGVIQYAISGGTV